MQELINVNLVIIKNDNGTFDYTIISEDKNNRWQGHNILNKIYVRKILTEIIEDWLDR